jgi:hypothetical protein
VYEIYAIADRQSSLALFHVFSPCPRLLPFFSIVMSSKHILRLACEPPTICFYVPSIMLECHHIKMRIVKMQEVQEMDFKDTTNIPLQKFMLADRNGVRGII